MLVCECVCVCAQLSPILCNTMDCRPPVSYPISYSRGSSQLRDQTGVSYISCIDSFFTSVPLGKLKRLFSFIQTLTMFLAHHFFPGFPSGVIFPSP